MSVVLVTGGSGFIGGHTLVQLLTAGHEVRTTVRTLQRATEVQALVKHGGIADPTRLSFFAADLQQDAGWAAAVAGCDFVLHVASPFPLGVRRTEDELVIPAREGALRVLRAAVSAGVRRVVLTSSFAAIGYGHGSRVAPFDETSWTALSGGVSAYIKSKTLAERAAWEFVAGQGGRLELAVVNPVGVFGPILGPKLSTSVQIVKQMLDGSMPACPELYFGIVDVRDVADLHLRAMQDPAAAGQRFLATAGDFVPLIEIARILRQRLGAMAAKAPTRQLPNWLVWAAALLRPEVRQALPDLGKLKNGSSAHARRLLGWSPRPSEEALVATAESLAGFGLLQPAD